METAPMAGKSWQPRLKLPREREKVGTCCTDKTVEREGRDRGGETTSEHSPLHLRLTCSRKTLKM